MSVQRGQLHNAIESLLATRAIKIDSALFGSILNQVLAGIHLSANSCGNTNDQPHRMRLSLPHIVVIEQPLNRLEYSLTAAERSATEGSTWSGIPYVAQVGTTMRTKRIRACVEYWHALEWSGEVAENHMQVLFRVETAQLSSNTPNSFPKTTPLIKTRRIIEYKFTSGTDLPVVGSSPALLGWRDLWEWNHVGADITIKDYHNGWTYIIVDLKPVLQGGSISYGVTSVTWLSPEGSFRSSHVPTVVFPDIDLSLFQQVPSLKQQILEYNQRERKAFTDFVARAFDTSEVKSLISGAINTYVTNKLPAGARITEIIESESSMNFIYSQP